MPKLVIEKNDRLMTTSLLLKYRNVCENTSTVYV